jgi:hypothetical protein
MVIILDLKSGYNGSNPLALFCFTDALGFKFIYIR